MKSTFTLRKRLAAGAVAAMSVFGAGVLGASGAQAAPVTLAFADANGGVVEMVVDEAVYGTGSVSGSASSDPTVAALPPNLQWVAEADGEGNVVLVLVDLNNFAGTPFANVADALRTVAFADGQGGVVTLTVADDSSSTTGSATGSATASATTADVPQYVAQVDGDGNAVLVQVA